MPATLPCPKIAHTPPKNGTFSPAISVIWRVRKRASACAMVRRIFLLIFLPSTPPLPALRRFAVAGGKPCFRQAAEAAGHVGDRGLVVHPSGQPFLRCMREDGAADREPLYDRRIGGRRKGRFEIGGGRVEPEQHHAPAPLIVARYRRLDVLPRR